MFVCCECCVLSGRGLCDELITRPEESYRLWCVVVCDLENLKNEEAMTRVGSQRHKKNPVETSRYYINKIRLCTAWTLKFSAISYYRSILLNLDACLFHCKVVGIELDPECV